MRIPLMEEEIGIEKVSRETGARPDPQTVKTERNTSPSPSRGRTWVIERE